MLYVIALFALLGLSEATIQTMLGLGFMALMAFGAWFFTSGLEYLQNLNKKK